MINVDEFIELNSNGSFDLEVWDSKTEKKRCLMVGVTI